MENVAEAHPLAEIDGDTEAVNEVLSVGVMEGEEDTLVVEQGLGLDV